jgi:replicative DNA helicase
MCFMSTFDLLIRNIAEVLIAKQRHCPIGTVELHFDGPFTRFSNLERRYSGDASDY